MRDARPGAAGSARAIAETISEAVRVLDLATLPGCGGFVWPADVDAVLTSLQLAAARLPQALVQSEQWLDEAMQAGRVGHDLDGDARSGVDGARKWLARAVTDASALARSLDVARQYTAHLTGTVPAGGER